MTTTDTAFIGFGTELQFNRAVVISFRISSTPTGPGNSSIIVATRLAEPQESALEDGSKKVAWTYTWQTNHAVTKLIISFGSYFSPGIKNWDKISVYRG